MITGELKNKIDGLWDVFAAGGLVNPLDVIEQITYLMFIHDLDDSDNLRAKEAAMLGLPYTSIFTDEVQMGERTIDGQQLKWSVFHDFPAGKMYSVMQEWVFPFIKNLHGDKSSAYSKYMDDAIFKLPTPLLLSKVVDALDEIYRLMNESQAVDVRGDTYEYLLSKISQSGRNGQFRTPRHIIRMMVELMDPKADDVICDPACGTSGFLVSAGEYLKEHRKEEIFFNRQKKDHYMNHMFFGYDMDRTMLRIGAMNMMTHGIDNPFIEYRDSLSAEPRQREVFPDFGQPAVQGQPGRRHRFGRSAESLQDQENGTAVFGSVPADAPHRRTLRLHRPGRRAIRLFHRTQSHPQRAGGRQPAGGRDLHAQRRIQALCRGVYRGADLHQDRPRWYRQCVVL